MIALLLAQQAPVYVIPPFDGDGPAYEARCQLVLADEGRQEISFSVSGPGGERRLLLEIDGEKIAAKGYMGAIGKDSSGRDRIDEQFTAPDGSNPQFMYRFQYSMPGPSALQTISLLRFNENRGEFFGLGLCWTTVADQ